MSGFKRFNFAFFGKQVGLPFVEDTGHIITPTAEKHPLTVHEGFELVYLVEGKFLYKIENGPDFTVHGRQIRLMKPGEKFYGKGGIFYPCNLYWLLFYPFSPALVDNTLFSRETIEYISRVFTSTAHRVVNASPYLEELYNQYGRIMQECSQTDSKPYTHPDSPVVCSPFQRSVLRTLICAITLEAADCFSKKELRKSTKCVQIACEFMHQHYQEEINVSNVVDHLNVSDAYLYKIFESEIGQSPNKYLQSLRFEKAADLLLNSTMSITNIAFESGFSSSQYFTKVFRKFTGKTPTEFRRDKDLKLEDENVTKKY